MTARRCEMIDAVPAGEHVPTADHRIWMSGLSWTQFEAFLALRGDAGPRVTFAKGTLELMSPSRDHETIKKKFAAVLEAYLDHHGIRYEGLGSWLLQHAATEVGLEPDECYVLHDLPKSRPDIAIEVVWTSGGFPKLALYEQLEVPEVWFWIADEVHFFVKTAGGYEQRATSSLVPGFEPSLLTDMLALETLSDVRRALRDRFG